MKKSIAILSMALLVGNAFAADVLEAGTAEAPKYYVIKANRGIPYVTYTADTMDNGGAETHLYRSSELSEAAVWGVVAGTEEGTVNIFNYTTKDDKRKKYMFTFITKSGDEFTGATQAVATTGGANDIYVKDNGNGSYGLALYNEAGVLDGGLYALDATGGSSEFLGNWQSIADGGTQWWFFAVDEANISASLENIEYSLLEEGMEAKVMLYSTTMANYAAAVPSVADELNAGIEALGKLEVSADYQEQIDAIWNQYVGQANANLNTMYNGKEVALNNLRKYNAGIASILGENEEGYYNGASSFGGKENAVFILESTVYEKDVEATEDSEATTEELPSYYLYNVGTHKYFGADRTPVDSKDEACSVRLMLQTGYDWSNANPIVGLAILANGVEGNNAFNLNQQTPPRLDYWRSSGSDSNGSIWSILAADEEGLNEYITASSVAKIESYVTKVPSMVANVLSAGIDEIKALTFTSDLAEKAEAIVQSAIEDANELLTTGMNGLNINIYYPRGNRYLSYNADAADWVAATSNESNNEIFTIKTVDGGVVLYNTTNNVYVGKPVLNDSRYDVQPTVEESEAQVFTVGLNNNSGYYGVSFLFNDEILGERALNMNLNAKCLHTYGKADGGSIFSIIAADSPFADSVDGLWYIFSPLMRTAVVTSEQDSMSNYKGLTNVSIPETVEYDGVSYTVVGIDDEAFRYCESITSIKIGEAVETIGKYAFYGYGGNKISSLEVPSSIKRIDTRAFEGCAFDMVNFTSLEHFLTIEYVDDYSNPATSAENLYINGSLVTEIVIPNTITRINPHTFDKCSNLTSIIIPNSVTEIGHESFSHCYGLTSLEIPNSVKFIDYEAFHYCHGLTSVIIGNSVANIGNSAFVQCESLNSITSLSTTPPEIDLYTFESYTYTNATLYVPDEALDAYKNDAMWSLFANIVGVEGLLDGISIYITGNGSVYNQSFGEINNGTHLDGEHFTFFILPDDNNYVASITLNGENVMSSLINHRLTISDYVGAGVLNVTFAEAAEATLAVKGADNHSFIHTYKEGTSAIVGLTIDDDWELYSLSFNGEDVTPAVENNVYVTEPLYGNNYLNMVLVKRDSTNIDNVSSTSSDVRISINNSTVTISGLATNDSVSVCDISGKVIYSGSKHVLTLTTGGIYILTTPANTFKIAL